jgi:hypothetical protein
MWNEPTDNTFIFGPVNHTSKTISSNIKEQRRERVTLSNPFVSGKIWTHSIISLDGHFPTSNSSHNPITPFVTKTFFHHHMMKKVPIYLVICFLKINLKDYPTLLLLHLMNNREAHIQETRLEEETPPNGLGLRRAVRPPDSNPIQKPDYQEQQARTYLGPQGKQQAPAQQKHHETPHGQGRAGKTEARPRWFYAFSFSPSLQTSSLSCVFKPPNTRFFYSQMVLPSSSIPAPTIMLIF